MLYQVGSRRNSSPTLEVGVFCAVAGEDELNREGDLGTEANIFYLLENDWEQGDDLAFLMVISAIFQ